MSQHMNHIMNPIVGMIPCEQLFDGEQGERLWTHKFQASRGVNAVHRTLTEYRNPLGESAKRPVGFQVLEQKPPVAELDWQFEFANLCLPCRQPGRQRSLYRN